LSHPRRIAAILAAGGLGHRFGGDNSLPKQFLLLGGKPMYLWSLKTLWENPSVGIIVIAARQDLHKVIAGQLESQIAGSKRILLAGAGKTRQASVYEALKVLEGVSERPTHVLVHDAARPFLDKQTLSEFISVLTEIGPCACAVPVSDTIKRTADDVIVETLKREGLYAMQTPQGAEFDLLLAAHRQAIADGHDATDDVALLERIQISVRVVSGSSTNIKMTNPEDMRIAEALSAQKIL